MLDDVASKVVEIIARQAAVEADQVQMDSTLEELSIDSLGVVESVFAIEEEFDISVPFNANDPTASGFDISNVRQIVSAVKRLIQEQKG